MKKSSKPFDIWKVKYPEQVVFVVTKGKDTSADIMPAGWFMPTSMEPPLVAISVGHTRYTHQLIKESGGFVISFPGETMEKEIICTGSHSGRDVDKFAELGIRQEPGKYLDIPLLSEEGKAIPYATRKQWETLWIVDPLDGT